MLLARQLRALLSFSTLLLLIALGACRAAAPGPPAEEKGSSRPATDQAADTTIDCRVPDAVNATDRQSLATRGEAYKTCFEKSQNPEHARRAVESYAQAAQLGREKEGRLLYTAELSELLVKLGDRQRLEEVFGPYLKSDPARDPDGYYLALVDYADALAKMGDGSSWPRHFERAIELHPQNNVEAINRYARHLIDRGRPAEAVEMLEKRLTREQRIRLARPAYLRQEALKRAGLDTASADEEVVAVESRRGRSAAKNPGSGP